MGSNPGGLMAMQPQPQQQQQQSQQQHGSQAAFGNMGTAQNLQSNMAALQNNPNFAQQRQQNQQGVEEDAKVTWDRATALSKEFRIFNFLEDPLLQRKLEKKAWKKPHRGMIKINFDASVYDKKAFYGLVARDANGFVLGGRTGFVNKEMHIEWAEIQAMEESINFARSNNWKNV
ncbi:hypothetical protein Goshw_029662, partial [Gossypium schwendimanii]|nr:hypothetical protein [Gossypium schwendimanii]